MNIINNNITYNAIDDLYNQVTGLPYSASAAAGNAGPGPEPVPTHNITIDQIQLIANQNVACFNKPWDCKIKVTFEDGVPENWDATIQFDSHVCEATCDYTDAHDTGVYVIPFTDGSGEWSPEAYDDYYNTYNPVWLYGDGEPTSATFTVYVDGKLYARQTSTNIFIQPLIENIVIDNMTAVEQDSHEYLFGFEVTTQDFDFTTLPAGWQGEAIYTDPGTWEDYRICIFNSDNVASSTTISKLTSFEYTPSDQANIQIHIYQSNNVELYEGMGVITITPYVSAKFTLNSVMIDGPYSGGPFSNVYNCHYNITFNETPPADCENGYGGYNGYAVITGVCVADETGVIKDTGNYQIIGIGTEYDHPGEYQYQSGDPAYPYGQTFGPATLSITDGDGNVWATATTDNVTLESI